MAYVQVILPHGVTSPFLFHSVFVHVMNVCHGGDGVLWWRSEVELQLCVSSRLHEPSPFLQRVASINETIHILKLYKSIFYLYKSIFLIILFL
jgi:hypothetical protein